MSRPILARGLPSRSGRPISPCRCSTWKHFASRPSRSWCSLAHARPSASRGAGRSRRRLPPAALRKAAAANSGSETREFRDSPVLALISGLHVHKLRPNVRFHQTRTLRLQSDASGNGRLSGRQPALNRPPALIPSCPPAPSPSAVRIPPGRAAARRPARGPDPAASQPHRPRCPTPSTAGSTHAAD